MKPYYTLADLLDEEHPFDAGEIVPARLAVIGFPIAHSKSPAMQQAALDAAGIRARYIRIQAAPEEFGEVVRLLRKRGFTGANVTVPHKQAACSLCSDTDALSRATGSVNTLVFQQDGSVSGFNTDGPGFARAIREERSEERRVFESGPSGLLRRGRACPGLHLRHAALRTADAGRKIGRKASGA